MAEKSIFACKLNVIISLIILVLTVGFPPGAPAD